jgi:hypothetical protein
MRVVSLALAARPHSQLLPFASVQVCASSGASMPNRRYSAPLAANGVAVDGDDLRARTEGRNLDGAIALDEDHRDDHEHERDQLAERLGKRAGGLPFGLLAFPFGHVSST